MFSQKIYLASDNWAPAHPAVLKAVIEANEGYAPAYGADPWTKQAEEAIQQAFKNPCKILFVPTGTGANVLGLSLACHRHESVICTDIAHIHYQESGAAESLIGCKLLTAPHQQGKLSVSSVLHVLKSERAFGKHSTSPRVVSITQPTELGTLYTLDELHALSHLCRTEHLLLHVDGSRLYNAAAALQVPLYTLIDAKQVDLLSLGGTKNGLLGAEALLLFNKSLHEGCDHVQKQTLQMLSKLRYVSAQYIPFFRDDLWKSLATHANQQAQKITAIIREIPSLSLSYPVETNQIFFTAPPHWVPRIQDAFSCYLWNREKNELRFITSWNTSDQDVAAVRSIIQCD